MYRYTYFFEDNVNCASSFWYCISCDSPLAPSHWILYVLKSTVLAFFSPSLHQQACSWIIDHVETKIKCRHLKKFICEGTLRQMFICLRPRTPFLPTTHCIRVQYTYSHREGGRVEPERRLEGQQFTKLGPKYQHDWRLYLQSINSDKHLPRSPFTNQFF
jgi:hypothetical protein